MKKALSLIAILAIILTSCEGPQGPMGAPGFDGEALVGETYETQPINFTEANDSFRFNFPSTIINGDAVLVYRLENILTAGDDGFDIWEPLPTATIFFDDGGFLQYRFNYTLDYVDIILESDDIAFSGPEFNSNQIFRIIVMPSDLVSQFEGDLSDINQVMGALDIQTSDIHKIQ
ncbi:MAG: hypothetical protein WBG71_06985 [Leeuwenhoekiella sp.]